MFFYDIVLYNFKSKGGNPMKKHIKKISNIVFPKRKDLLFFYNSGEEVETVLKTLTERDIDNLLAKMTNTYKFKKDLKTSSKIVRNLIKSPSFSEKHIDMLLDNNLAFLVPLQALKNLNQINLTNI